MRIQSLCPLVKMMVMQELASIDKRYQYKRPYKLHQLRMRACNFQIVFRDPQERTSTLNTRSQYGHGCKLRHAKIKV